LRIIRAIVFVYQIALSIGEVVDAATAALHSKVLENWEHA
jgi:hypothetical protein